MIEQIDAAARVALGWVRATTAPAPPPAGGVDPVTGHGPEWGKAAPIGLLVIVLLGVACYCLARSFSRNIKRVPASFDAVPAPIGAVPASTPAAANAAAANAAAGAAAAAAPPAATGSGSPDVPRHSGPGGPAAESG